ncbi:hypothetical protein GCM10009853_054820 [Glycomyces scopariae]|uniref:Uncharacterized protein n=1 Tax=Glycomyces sambucus TaxID=380244 RepID=A0A1G9LCI7_9ACTN|nr:hypothetical protein [Glycomyces sambucus]SDL59245.1 hypothetical protein SAMN05216298_4407 [Glycomyces sambucus]
MAESMFETARDRSPKTKTWRAVFIGLAVPVAMLAAAPAVGAAETTDRVETVAAEQLPPLPVDPPPLPGGLPDPTALTDLATCLTDLQAALDAGAPLPAELEEEFEQLPPLPVPVPGGDPALPDIGALAQTCQDILATVTGAVPPVDPPVDVPAVPKD